MASYYSGDLAGINQGRTADAAVNAADQASLRNYLASLAQTKVRSQLGTNENATRRELGLADINLRGNLGQSDIGLRRELGLGGLDVARSQVGEMGADRGLRRELGLATLKQGSDINAQDYKLRLAELDQQYGLETARINAIKEQAAAGKVMDWRDRMALYNAEESAKEIYNQAQAIASRINSEAETAAKGRSWFSGDAADLKEFQMDPVLNRSIFDKVVARQPIENMSMVKYDPAAMKYVPQARSSVLQYFGSPQQVAPVAASPESLQTPSRSSLIGAPADETRYQRFLRISRQNQ